VGAVIDHLLEGKLELIQENRVCGDSHENSNNSNGERD
jgi:hypothetical protein